MKKNLDKNMLDAVSGGLILRQPNGTYIVYGRDDFGIDLWEKFGDDFNKALGFDWEHFNGFYRSRNINTKQELEDYYDRKFFNPHL